METILGDIYNEKVKEEFLHQYEQKTRKFYRYILTKSYSLEKTLDKDISEFSKSNLAELLNHNKSGSLQAIRTKVCIFNKYIDFCLENDYTTQDRNYLKTKYFQDLNKYVVIERKKYISKEDLQKIVTMCVNAQDAILFALLFDGVKGENSEEIVNLKATDCNFETNVLKLTRNDGTQRLLKASNLTMSLIEEAISEREYIKNNGEESEDMRARTYPIHPTEYVVRISAREPNGAINPINVISRINRIKAWYGNPLLTITNIWMSGMLSNLRIIKTKNINLGKEHYVNINKKFGYNKDYWLKTQTKLQQYV